MHGIFGKALLDVQLIAVHTAEYRPNIGKHTLRMCFRCTGDIDTAIDDVQWERVFLSQRARFILAPPMIIRLQASQSKIIS